MASNRNGFHCPKCPLVYGVLFVYRTRNPCPSRVVRYRECRKCGYRVVTSENQTKTAPAKKRDHS